MSETPALTAIICTHNPRVDYLSETLESLKCQHALDSGQQWELLIIDNASKVPLDSLVDLSWHVNARIVREERLGLTHARLRSFHEARANVLVYIDDDNVLDPDYLRLTHAVFKVDLTLGAIGGKALPRWEEQPPQWFHDAGVSLACRDLGGRRIEERWLDPVSRSRTYPECAPIGAGMGVRKEAYARYVEQVELDAGRVALGRRGLDLSSGEDNDMVLTILASGWSVAYVPELKLLHLIPARRLTLAYLERYVQTSNRTWVQVLSVHGICPWAPISPWTLACRKLRSWVRLKGWHGPANKLAWRAACGIFEGRARMARVSEAD